MSSSCSTATATIYQWETHWKTRKIILCWQASDCIFQPFHTLLDSPSLSANAVFSVDDFQWGRKTWPLGSFNARHTHTLPLSFIWCMNKLVSFLPFLPHYNKAILSLSLSTQKAKRWGFSFFFFFFALAIPSLMNWVDCSDAGTSATEVGRH